jgi:enoyl-CoA hydratase/carnithine racemase
VVELKRDGNVFVLCMRAGENRFNADFLDAVNAALDDVEASEGPAALVTTGEGKFYSNGLDLDWMGGEGRDRATEVLGAVDVLFGRLLTFPMATVAAINGHAFAAGGMLSLAHDFRVMRRDRGYFCLPEIDLATGQPLTEGMYAVIAERLTRAAFHEALVTGRRYGGEDAALRGIVTEAVAEEDVLPRAIGIARDLEGKHRPTMAALKRGLYRDALAAFGR